MIIFDRMNEIINEVKNLFIVMIATSSVHKFKLAGLHSMLDGVTLPELLQKSFLYPIIGWLVLFVLTRTIGVILSKQWDDRFKKTFDDWRKKRKL